MLDKNLYVYAPENSNISISGNSKPRTISIQTGKEIYLEGIIVKSGFDAMGRGIYNEGILHLKNVLIAETYSGLNGAQVANFGQLYIDLRTLILK